MITFNNKIKNRILCLKTLIYVFFVCCVKFNLNCCCNFGKPTVSSLGKGTKKEEKEKVEYKKEKKEKEKEKEKDSLEKDKIEKEKEKKEKERLEKLEKERLEKLEKERLEKLEKEKVLKAYEDAEEKLKAKLNDGKVKKGEKFYDISFSRTNNNLDDYVYVGTEECNYIKFTVKNEDKDNLPNDAKIEIIDIIPEGIDDKFKYKLVIDDSNIGGLKTNDTKEINFKFENIVNLPAGTYNGLYIVSSNGKMISESYSISLHVVSSYNEEDENIKTKIAEFRVQYGLTEENYSNDRLKEVLSEANFDFQEAFEKLF